MTNRIAVSLVCMTTLTANLFAGRPLPARRRVRIIPYQSDVGGNSGNLLVGGVATETVPVDKGRSIVYVMVYHPPARRTLRLSMDFTYRLKL